MLGGSLAGTAFCFFALRACTFYPGLHQGLRVTLLATLSSLFLLCDAAGRVGFHWEWRRIYGMTGPRAEFRDSEGRWSLKYPGQWVAREILLADAQTVVFQPTQLTPAIQMTLTRRSRRPNESLTDFVTHYYMGLNKNPATRISDAQRFTYTGGVPAYLDVQEEKGSALPLRQENVFLVYGENAYLLSLTAVPAWFERFSEELRSYLNGLTLTS